MSNIRLTQPTYTPINRDLVRTSKDTYPISFGVYSGNTQVDVTGFTFTLELTDASSNVTSVVEVSATQDVSISGASPIFDTAGTYTYSIKMDDLTPERYTIMSGTLTLI